jgi:spectrin beta
MAARSEHAGFEKGRIKQLQDEREATQKKTFTKWTNSFLSKAGLKVNDLFTDLGDGMMLTKLLEIISGERLPPVGYGKLRINKIENIGRCIHFLQGKKVNLENIGPEDIVDGNPRLILGLIWCIILRFQIQEIELQDESLEVRHANEALLLWCQMKTKGYPGVDVQNFHKSWKDGLAFNALIHKHRPDLIDWEGLEPGNNMANLNNAFDVAEKDLGIPRLLDAEDVNVLRPDERSVITQLVAYYHYFSKMKAEETGGRKLNKLMEQVIEIEAMKVEYDNLCSQLLAWIEAKIGELSDRNFANMLTEIQQLMRDFKTYRTVEKPPKYNERGVLEVQLFNIQMKLQAAKQKIWYPPEGKLVSDINKAWVKLEAAEHGREVALRKELQRQERLEQLAEKFNRKAGLRESWLNDMLQVLDELEGGKDKHGVDIALKRHEAIRTDVEARGDRIEALQALSNELAGENYHGTAGINAKEKEIVAKWEELRKKLASRKSLLTGQRDLMAVFLEMDTCLNEMAQMKVVLQSEDFGKHLAGVQDLLQKHGLVEADITALAERVKSINGQAQKFVQQGHPDSARIKVRQSELDSACGDLQKLAAARHNRLKESLKLQEFYRKAEEEDSWIKEKEQIVSSSEVGRGLSHVLSLQQKHQSVENELTGHKTHFQSTIEDGNALRSTGHYASKAIGTKVTTLQDKWKKLNELAATRRARLEEAVQIQQYYADANESESWMAEIEPVVSSKDYGRDENSAQTLLESHERVETEVKAYNSEIDRLKEMSRKVFEKSAQSGMERAVSPFSPEKYDEVIEEEEVERDVPYEVEEVQEREVEQEVMQEVTVPQVRARYSYEGQGLGIKKGEVFYLLKKANKDWWSVRRPSGQEGFVPANYMEEVDPAKLQRKVKKKVLVPTKVKVRKTRKEIVKVPKTVRKPKTSRWSRSMTRQDSSVISRQQAIGEHYAKLSMLVAERRKRLEDAIRQFKLFRDCDDLESWIKEKEVVMKAEEKGSGREKVEAMQKKFETFCTDLAANSVRVMEVNNEADAMVKGGHHEASAIKQRQRQLNAKWAGLQDLKAVAEGKLNVSQTLQDFHQMCDETKSWINEKDQALSTDDCGRDLPSVQALQRRHQALERELAPVEERLAKLKEKSQQVTAMCPTKAQAIQRRQAEVSAMWDRLKTKAKSRKATLDSAFVFQNFLADTRDLMAWSGEMKALMASQELAKDVEGAEALLEQHEERKQEIKNKQEKFDNLIQLGERLGVSPRVSGEVMDKVKMLVQEKDALNEAASLRSKQLHQCHQLQLFYKDAEQVDTTTANQEAFLTNEDLGASVDGTETLLKKHEEFETSSQPHDERIRALSDQANKLIHGGHYDATKIAARRDAIISRRQRVKQMSADRKSKLLDSLVWQKFSRDADEVSAWISEKMQVATDESYRDPTNLSGKLQKHQAFEAELTANKDRVEGVCMTGSKLVQDNHYKTPEVKERMQAVTEAWEQLNDASAEKGKKLKEANDLQQFLRAIDDENIWISEAEALLTSDDVGKDLPSVQFLLKKHQQLEADFALHLGQAEGLATQGQQLIESKHFESGTIEKKMNSKEGWLTLRIPWRPERGY